MARTGVTGSNKRFGSPASPNKAVRAKAQAVLYRARIHRAQRQQKGADDDGVNRPGGLGSWPKHG
jgi:hypothetical protein